MNKPPMNKQARTFNNAAASAAKYAAQRRKEALDEAVRILNRSELEVKKILAGAPSDWQAYHYSQLLPAISAALKEAEKQLTEQAEAAHVEAVKQGRSLVDAPLAASVQSADFLPPVVDSRQILAMRHMTVKLIKGVCEESSRQIKDQLGLVIAGVQTPGQAVDALSLQFNGDRSRALTVLRTELGTAYAAATQERMETAKEYLPKLQKQWRKSGKLRGRFEHAAADGQIQDVDKPFLVGGEEIMFPRAPGVSARNRINCGCESLPWMANWEMTHPGSIPPTDKEQAKSQSARYQATAQRANFEEWANKIITGDHLSGSWKTVGVIPDEVLVKLKDKGFAPVSPEVAISDRRLYHMLPGREHKKDKGIPPVYLSKLPSIIDRPDAGIWWDKQKNTLIFATNLGSDYKGNPEVGVIPVSLRHKDAKGHKRMPHNWLLTGSKWPKNDLKNAGRFERLD